MGGGLDAGGPALWPSLGAAAAVLMLLVLALRALQRWQPGQGVDARVRLLEVRRLGPRRELQVLRVGDVVHTLYRQEGAMVVLKSEPFAAPAAETVHGEAATRWPTRLRAMAAAVGGRPRRTG